MPKILCIKILTGSSLLPRCPGLEHSITFTTMLHVDDRKLLFPPKHFLGTPKTSWELTWRGLSNVTISCRASSVGTFRTQKKGRSPQTSPMTTHPVLRDISIITYRVKPFCKDGHWTAAMFYTKKEPWGAYSSGFFPVCSWLVHSPTDSWIWVSGEPPALVVNTHQLVLLF